MAEPKPIWIDCPGMAFILYIERERDREKGVIVSMYRDRETWMPIEKKRAGCHS